MTELQITVSPIDGTVLAERQRALPTDLDHLLSAAQKAQADGRRLSVLERAAYVSRGIETFVSQKDSVAEEITRQMGRAIRHSPGEVDGVEERARYMIEVAESALSDTQLEPKPGFRRFIRHESLGVILVLAPWNYPYLTAINSLVPALMAGNSLLLKHSSQTPLCAERLTEAFAAAGLPAGVLQCLHAGHDLVELAVQDPRVAFVALTGSVPGGHAIQQAAAERFIGTGLELGGKDPAYVRADAEIEHAVELLVDGAFYNAGQSCCGIERIYVDDAVYEVFVERYVDLVQRYRLGNPLDPATTLGPMVLSSAADVVRAQAADAVSKGARQLIDPSLFPIESPATPYLAPQVFVDVGHSMTIMTEETFGPAVGIMRTRSDEEAIALMNRSRYGLTAVVCTTDAEAAVSIGERVESGTWFMNRCDYLDPALPWVGVKDSGRGCTLSALGYAYLTRPKSFHLRTSL